MPVHSGNRNNIQTRSEIRWHGNCTPLHPQYPPQRESLLRQKIRKLGSRRRNLLMQSGGSNGRPAMILRDTDFKRVNGEEASDLGHLHSAGYGCRDDRTY